jgi:hypothetical protein
MNPSLSRVSTLILLVFALSISPAHAATVSLLDLFDDGDLATNTGLGGVGSGFTSSFVDCGSGMGVSAGESDGNATVSGASCVHWVQSNDAIDPTDSTLIWSIKNRPSGTSTGVMVGWTQAGKDACCDTGIVLAIEGHRVTFGLQTGNAWQPQSRFFEIAAGSTTAHEVYDGYTSAPLTATISVSSTGWEVRVIGEGVDIHKSGTYASCPNPVGGLCISLTDVLTYTGVNGVLHPFGGAFREHDASTFDSVLVISN